LLALLSLAVLTDARSEELSFNRDIRPILSDNCFYCHGPDKNNRKADLRLDMREELIKLGPQTLIERINTTDADDLMPPAESHKKLTVKQKETMKQWIDEGAKYEPHWAFVPPVKPKVGNAIDDFIRAELKKHGLQPAPKASRETLMRRLALDLTGLPPKQSDLLDQSELSDYIDQLLQSPHYGEHMAVAWLDAARFADTNGYQVDRDRELWPWRGICCRRLRWIKRSPPVFIAITCSMKRAASSQRSSSLNTPPTAWKRPLRSGWGKPSTAVVATITNMIPSRSRTFTR
jgi:hypothetical protein